MTRRPISTAWSGETLVVAAEQCHIDGGCDAVFPFAVHQDREEVTMEVVHRVVIITEFGRLRRVTGKHNGFGVVPRSTTMRPIRRSTR
jgi:hypothetical protein